jgi:hypothetical protein
MIAPDPILRAGLDTVSWACIYARNQSLNESCNVKELNEVMEAVHEVPRILMSWSDTRLREVRTHLGCFSSTRYPGSPDLVAHFDKRLAENEEGEQDVTPNA